MKNIYQFFISIIVSLLCFSCSSGGVNKTAKGFSIKNDSTIIEVSCLDTRIIHIQTYPIDQPQKKSMVVDDDSFQFSDFKVKENKETVTLETNLLKVEYNYATKNIRFIDKQTDKIVLTEHTRKFIPTETLGDKAYSVSQTFALSDDEAIYGLGQFQEGLLNYRGQKVNLVQANREIANPVLLSTQNYLLYWDNYSKTIFEDNGTGATFESEVGDGVNYYFVYGKNMNDAIVGFRNLTGQAPMLPKSAFGFWMSKERYKSFDELVSVVKEFRKRQIPLDNIVQDWQYWGKDQGLWNSMEFNPENFSNPKEVIDELHNKYNVKLTLSVWPGVGPKTKIYQAMDSAKALFDVPTWAGYKVVDIYNPAAQQIYWDYLYRGLYTKGVDSWWMDATEPSFKEGQYQDKQEKWTKAAGMTFIGPFSRYLNTYSLVLSRVMYENLRKVDNKRVSILTRSAFAGQQKYSTSTWSGDIYASWDIFKKQIPAGLNFCMTGIPYWTTDIGGFIVKSPEKTGAGSLRETAIGNKDEGYEKGLQDPAYLELYTRWFQYAVFNPMFRAHGTDIPREVWQFGQPGTTYYDAQIKMINLRYSLLSYIYSAAWQVTSQGNTMMRALAMDFTDDKAVYNNADGYMFGDALLIYPVTHPMFYERKSKIANPNTELSLYLPKHASQYWFDFNSDKCYQAGTTIKYNAPLDIIPVFAKAGTIVPRNKPAQYATDGDDRTMDIIVYGGADAHFTLYEDDNETYDYEKGLYSSIHISWNDAKNEISFSAPEGKMTPQMSERIFNVKIIRPNTNGISSSIIKSVTYNNVNKTLIIN